MSKIPHLTGISLRTQPCVKKAIAWSCDAELAVAGDDSVTVFVPEYPDLEWSDTHHLADEGIEPGQDDRGTVRPPHQVQNEAPRRQFFHASRQLPVSNPALHPRLNAHLFEAYNRRVAVNDPPARLQSEGSSPLIFEPASSHNGAGRSLIAGAGSTLNHVVSIDWSPTGVGRNLRPVLGVLTSRGCLSIYGELQPTTRRGQWGRPERDLGGWGALWAVGASHVLPGQGKSAERVVAFAWAKPLKSDEDWSTLLAYVNDEDDLVVIAIRTDSDADGKLTWHVREASRCRLQAPHEKPDAWDPDYIPGGSSFALSWSSWHADAESATCVISHLQSNYVSFRKLVLTTADVRWHDVKVVVDESDWSAQCLSLGTDAFIEWEHTDSNGNGIPVCRGVIATPSQAIPFRLDLSTKVPQVDRDTHSTTDCQTLYQSDEEAHQNPIMGLIIHQGPADLLDQDVPYTAVRLSATATNASDWIETNIDGYSPAWVTETGHKVSATAAQDAEDENSQDEDGDDEDAANGQDDFEQDVIMGNGAEDDTLSRTGASSQKKDVYTHRARIWGIVASPGGGTTAILVSTHQTQYPERGSWHNYRTRVLFGRGPKIAKLDDALQRTTQLTTEGRMWEWMYGRGQGVVGLTPPLVGDVQDDRQDEGHNEDTQRRDRLRELRSVFAGLVDRQRCNIWAGEEALFQQTRAGESICANGHVMATCVASSLAIVSPGTSRTCGVCLARCLKVGLLREMLDGQDEATHILDGLDGLGKVCVRCGGKWLV